MRLYYIYKQICEPVDFIRYKWLPYQWVCNAYGTKELYDIFGDCKSLFGKRLFEFGNSLQFDNKPFIKRYFDPEVRYLIIDEFINVRNYFELTEKYRNKWERRVIIKKAYNTHYNAKVIGERRKGITPQEIQEIKNEYGFYILPIKPKRKIDLYDLSEFKKGSKSWKDQSKRRKQYKVKDEM